MKSFLGNVSQSLILILVLISSIHATLSAQESNRPEEKTQAFLYDIPLEEETPESALFQILTSEARFTIVGNNDIVVNASIKARTEEDAMDQLAAQMDWLVTRRGTRYIVYVEGAEETLGDRPINYMFKCRSVRAGDILQILEGKPPVGFPQPDQLGTTGEGSSYGGYGGYSSPSSNSYSSPSSYGFPGSSSDSYPSSPSFEYPGSSSSSDPGTSSRGLARESGLEAPGPLNGLNPNPTFAPVSSTAEVFGVPIEGAMTVPVEGSSLPPVPALASGAARRKDRSVRNASYNSARSGSGLQPPDAQQDVANPGPQMIPDQNNPGAPVFAPLPAGDSPLPFKTGRGLDLPLGKVQYDVIPNLNTIMIRGKLEDVRNAVEFLQTIDQPVPVVLVELLIVQFVHCDDFTWRYDVFNGQIARGNAPSVTEGGTTLPITTNFGNTPWGVNAEGIGLSATDGGGPMAFTAVGNLTASFRQNLKFLISKKQARIVTNPHIAVVSGNQGRIELNEEFNYQTSLVFPTAGTTNVGQAEKLQAQTQLTVTPTVISEENIHMAINTDLAAFVPNITTGAIGTLKNLPDKRQSRISTSITLPEGDTIIIGGLVKEEATDARSKIPGVNRVPVVGNLFKARSSTKQFTETVIYITPKTTMPQGYEDEYRKQIFEQMARLQCRGEEVTSAHRADDQQAFQIRQINDEIDHMDWKDRMRQKMHRMRFWDRRGKSEVYCPPQAQMTPERATQDSNAEEPPETPQEEMAPEQSPDEAHFSIPPTPEMSAPGRVTQTQYSTSSQRARRPASPRQ